MKCHLKTTKAYFCYLCVFFFQSGSLIDRVFSTYKQMHTNQTLDFVKQKVGELTENLTILQK